MSVATLPQAQPAEGARRGRAAAGVDAAGSGVYFAPGQAPFQRHVTYRRSHGPADTTSPPLRTAFPGVLQPSNAGGPAVGVDDLVAAAEALGAQPRSHELAQSSQDESQLRKLLDDSAGALLFRNTPLRTADDFSRFAHALGKGGRWTYHVDRGLMVLRFVHAPNVATANEGPNTVAIGSHNEYGLSSHFPSYAFFFCVSQPAKGGETPIASSLEIYDKLAARSPEFVQALRDRGLRFSIHHQRDVIEGNLQGNALLKADAFGPADGKSTEGLNEDQIRKIVDDNVRALGIEGGWKQDVSAEEAAQLPAWQRRGFSAEWLPDGSILSHQRVPGVRPHPWLGRETFFNNMHNRNWYSQLHHATDYPHASKIEQSKQGAPVYQYPPYLSGSDDATDPDTPVPREWFDLLEQVTSESQVDVAWQPGDVLLLDNLSVQHARRTWEGPRKLLASFWDAPK